MCNGSLIVFKELEINRIKKMQVQDRARELEEKLHAAKVNTIHVNFHTEL